MLQPRPSTLLHQAWQGVYAQVQVIAVKKESSVQALAIALYVGRIKSLQFDPSRWQWRQYGFLHCYIAKLDKSFIESKLSLSRSIPSKWAGALPATYEPNWKEVWAKGRLCKEATFLWSLYHDAIAVNAWRYQISPNIALDCVCCNLSIVETKLHYLYACPKAQAAWQYALTVLYSSMEVALVRGSWPFFTWQQYIFGSRLPAHLKAKSHFWSLYCSLVLWLIWKDRNSLMFANENWST